MVSFTKINGMYFVKSGYQVARNILNTAEDQGEPSIKTLQAFAWKIRAPTKLKHFIWQAISGQLAVTSNLTNRHIRCDNHCPRCGADDETINHAIFECPPALQTWAHAATPTPHYKKTSHIQHDENAIRRQHSVMANAVSSTAIFSRELQIALFRTLFKYIISIAFICFAIIILIIAFNICYYLCKNSTIQLSLLDLIQRCSFVIVSVI